ncbi:tetratricopeptide repeat protein [Leptolyngbya sp. AN02str]|uniref:J domain-containing protein n=1 Tax=Leptolyngbya sp. AN02str TaxID=3423363 RepID=UPI003D32130E
MSLKIDQGLFGFEFTDHHAVLGAPVDADAKEIRKYYLKLARRLHPDSCAKESEEDRQRAAEFLSKLVNPAYEILSNEKSLVEHQVLLKLKGQQALRQQETVVLTGEVSRKLAEERGELDYAYRMAVKKLAEEQYHHLDKTIDVTGQISELNLVYVMRKSGKSDFLSPSPAAPTTQMPASGENRTTAPPAPGRPAAAPKPPQTKDAIVAAYMRRSQEFEKKNDFTSAIKELRDALQMAPTNATVHSRLGLIYYKSKQLTMAKIHFRKALELNPEDTIAQEGMRRIDGAAASAPGQKAAANPKKPDAKAAKTPPKNGKSQGGGLFGLFGGKKK